MVYISTENSEVMPNEKKLVIYHTRRLLMFGWIRKLVKMS